MVPSLPLEVYEEIVDHIGFSRYEAELRLKTLLFCCLAFKSWLIRCRSHLFTTVTLKDAVQYRLFVDSLKSNIDNGAHVVNFVVDTPKLLARALSESWVSAVPLELSYRLPNLILITFNHLDLSAVNSKFFPSLTLFQ